MAGSTRVRMTATERSEQVLRAAVSAFAESGYAATRTDEIARLAGVSQPYVIRLFGTKQQLFIAAMQRVCDRMEEVFRSARAEAAPDATSAVALRALGRGYAVFLADRELLQLFLHGISASSDDAIGSVVRDRFGEIHQLIRELSGASLAESREFLGVGMLLTVMSAMRAAGPDAEPTPWAGPILESLLTTID